MPLDLSRLGVSKGQALTVPRDIFAALPSKPWPRLRLEQGEVLKAWYDRRARRDVVIKQNTGGGKTVIGLLVAQSSLNEGAGPAVYLAPDTYLAAQVIGEAGRLGITVVSNPRDHRFIASEAVLVTTFHKLVNGRSVFGVGGTGRPARPVGTVVVDDAHAALAIAEGQFKIQVPAGHAGYDELLRQFAGALKHQSPSSWASLQEGGHAGPIRVPFWTWTASQDRVLQILRKYGDDDQEKWIYFSWPLLQQTLHLAVATVTSREIEIRPPCPPIDLIPSFAQAKRRVYLTATLADDGVLVTELGADPDDLAKPVTPDRAADLGDRLILAPMAITPRASAIGIRQLVREFAEGDRTSTGMPTAPPLNAIVLGAVWGSDLGEAGGGLVAAGRTRMWRALM
ncbi:DEAD/DEAH box helicase [Sphaerisporangium corydalis]|uniref:DEAD/DEAH box helicase n=1 Tax=Sphaerisporangium corydalis TaxID=1441875 RepID=A0ABV9EKY4_9ACTN|nr:DEAD/DEAH box helicase [Sphaerisporangium corydalis]